MVKINEVGHFSTDFVETFSVEKNIDEDSGEADILLSDGLYSIECFCSDCDVSEGDMFTDIIYGFNIKHIVKSLNEEYIVDKKTDDYDIA